MKDNYDVKLLQWLNKIIKDSFTSVVERTFMIRLQPRALIVSFSSQIIVMIYVLCMSKEQVPL